MEGVVVSPAEIEQEYKKKYEKIKAQWVLVKPDLYNKESEPSEQDLKNYYEANKSQFMTPTAGISMASSVTLTDMRSKTTGCGRCALATTKPPDRAIGCFLRPA